GMVYSSLVGSRAETCVSTTAGAESTWTRFRGLQRRSSRLTPMLFFPRALFQKHKLAPGETGMALVLARSMDQARTVFGYVKGFLEASPALAREVVAIKQSEIELRNGIVIAVHSNSYRTVRGRTLVAAVLANRENE